MTSRRRFFSDELKTAAVRRVLDEGETLAQVARDLDLVASVLRTWVRQARADRDGGKSGLTTDERAELARRRKCQEGGLVTAQGAAKLIAVVHSSGWA